MCVLARKAFQPSSAQMPAHTIILPRSVSHSVCMAHTGVITVLKIKPSYECMCLFVSVSVGYEYESCPGFIQWERRTALMQGFELVPSNLGGWSLDKHHALNIRSGEYKHIPYLLKPHTHKYTHVF